jgi:hypothetical protein
MTSFRNLEPETLRPPGEYADELLARAQDRVRQ